MDGPRSDLRNNNRQMESAEDMGVSVRSQQQVAEGTFQILAWHGGRIKEPTKKYKSQINTGLKVKEVGRSVRSS